MILIRNAPEQLVEAAMMSGAPRFDAFEVAGSHWAWLYDTYELAVILMMDPDDLALLREHQRQISQTAGGP